VFVAVKGCYGGTAKYGGSSKIQDQGLRFHLRRIDGAETAFYQHMSDIVISPYRRKPIPCGQWIGKVGCDAVSGAPHLHLALEHGNPERYTSIRPAKAFRCVDPARIPNRSDHAVTYFKIAGVLCGDARCHCRLVRWLRARAAGGDDAHAGGDAAGHDRARDDGRLQDRLPALRRDRPCDACARAGRPTRPEGRPVDGRNADRGRRTERDLDVRAQPRIRAAGGRRRVQRGRSRRCVVAPSGRELVFTRDEDLFTVDARGKNVKRLFDGRAYAPDWSPNGDVIVFVRNAAEGTGGGIIHAIGVDGRDLRAVTPGGHPEVSPDGSKVASRAARASTSCRWPAGRRSW
jgi:hypothetical protein